MLNVNQLPLDLFSYQLLENNTRYFKYLYVFPLILVNAIAEIEDLDYAGDRKANCNSCSYQDKYYKYYQ